MPRHAPNPDDPAKHEGNHAIKENFMPDQITRRGFVKASAAALGTGAVAALNYAWRVMLLPQGVFAQSVATAAFPTFADQTARGQKQAMSEWERSAARSV